MDQMKKKRFGGYSAEDVDKTISGLSHELASLQQEISTGEKVFSDNDEEEASKFSTYIEDLRHEIAVKDRFIESLKAELENKEQLLIKKKQEAALAANSANGGKVLNEQAVKKALDSYREAIHAKDSEIASLKTSNEGLRGENASLRAKITELQAEIESSKKIPSPDMKIIERAYTNAFHGAKDIANEAKVSIGALTDRVFFELNSDIAKTTVLYNNISESKNKLANFLEQGMEHFRAIQNIIDSAENIELNTAEHVRMLNQSREKILADVDKSASAFDVGLENSIHTAAVKYETKEETAPAMNVISEIESENDDLLNNAASPEINIDPLQDELLSLTIDSFYENIQPDEAADFMAEEELESPYLAANVTSVIKAVDAEDPDSKNETDIAETEYDSSLDEADNSAFEEMRDSIKRAISQNNQSSSDEQNEGEDEKANPADEATPNAANEGSEGEKKQKINVQDILKKYSK